MRAEKSNAERYDTHFSAFDLSAIEDFCVTWEAERGIRYPADLRRRFVNAILVVPIDLGKKGARKKLQKPASDPPI